MNVEQVLSQMTAEEKAALVSGTDFTYTNPIPQLGIPSLCMSDGPHGLRKQIGSGDNGISTSEPSTAFPTAATTASGWDPENTRRMGAAIAEECRHYGVHTLLGPGVNIVRNPLCGRNYEYYSEDPLLSGKLAAAVTRGVQETPGNYVTIKHFAANNQEENRYFVSSNLDERTLREIYLRGFEIAVREAGPKAVMSAYNRINGVYCANNRELCTDILRGEWGFDGLVMTDWLSTGENRADEAGCLNAGVDLIMPGGKQVVKALLKAYKDGRLTDKTLRQCCGRVLEQL